MPWISKMTPNMLELRIAKTSDQPGITDLIRRVYHEYGEQLCLDGADSDLLNIATNYLNRLAETEVDFPAPQPGPGRSE